MKKYLFLLLLSVLMVPAKAQVDSLTIRCDSVPALPWPQSLQANIDTLIQTSSLLEISEVGLMVYDLTADSVLYKYNHRHTLRPASNMKLITAIAALDRLGAKHQLRTTLYYTGVRDSSTLRGDLYCVGGMDPLFDKDDLQAFVEGVRTLGIDTIRGRLVADKSMKDADLLGWGWCWDDDNPVLSPLHIERKDLFLEHFVQALRKAGIYVDAQLCEGRLPVGATYVVASVHTISHVLPQMMKDSDNLLAESLFYQLAASSGARPATAKHARQIINKLIDKLGPSLPIAGRDGTLSKRMRKTIAEGNVHAKTGTLKGVTTLAGYCTAANGHVLCFAIMNQGVMQLSRGRDFQDRLCVLMCQ